jgi:hypothetical protein
MRHHLLIDHDRMMVPHPNIANGINPILAAIGHIDYKRQSFSHGRFQHIPGHKLAFRFLSNLESVF